MSDPTTPVAWGIQLAKLWLMSGQGFPVKVAEIALEVTKRRFADPIGCVVPHGIDGIDGMLSKRQKKQDWVISYDENVTTSGRINFTIAHEFGHYLLHRNLRDSFQCGQPAMMEYDSPESKKIESQANIFASYLLMPRNDFEAQVAGQEYSIDLFGQCAQRYQTSLTATILKWLEFTSEAAILVVADHDEFICWSYCSQSAKGLGVYKSPGEVVPSSAVEFLRIHTVEARTPHRVAPGVWHSTEEAVESAIVSEQFEQLIFLVRFPFSSAPDHEEEPESDAFTVLSEKSQGLNWRK